MKWRNLKANLCPSCSHKLERTKTGYECKFVDPYHNSPCGFFITLEKHRELVDKMKKPR